MRYSLIDSIRGAAIISMVLYHTMWDLVFMFGVNAPWYNGTLGYVWQQSICWTFILVSGFCQAIAKHSLKDAFLVSGSGLLVTIVSLALPMGAEIIFGILTFLGLAMFLTIPLKRFYNRINPVWGIAVSALLFALTKRINNGYLGFGPFTILKLPASLYPAVPGYFITLLGFTVRGFYSGDYFSLIPWYFLFACGYFLCRFFKQRHEMSLFKEGRVPFLDFLGRHSLLIYLLHQPIIYLVLELIFH